MTRLSHLYSDTSLTAGLSYFEYQYSVARRVIIPWLAERIDLDGRRLADFGSHEGGMLEAFRDDGRVASAQGFELRAEVVARSQFQDDERFRLEQRDLLTLRASDEDWDLILLCDVLEHIPESAELLALAAAKLAAGGVLLLTFPPYWSPFGGHQQLASNWARLTPYLHYLPEDRLLRIARVDETPYLTREAAIEDMRSIRRTRLTLRKAERAISDSPLRLVKRKLYLFRPEYGVRYGLPTVRAGLLGRLPGVRELIVMGAYYLLQRP